jgi:1-acyl-sn-glycerol-3-phosphate acyltransferase
MGHEAASASLDHPWARTLPARAAREVIICGVFGSLIRWYARRDVSGHEHLQDVPGPVLFVANHCSHVDTPALLASLPARFRRRTAVAAAADYFYEKKLLAHAVSLSFCTIPLERRGGGVGEDATAHMKALVDDRWSLVVFAEGTRSRDGRVGRLRSGAAVLAAEYGMPIVPVHVGGTHVAMPTGSGWMSRPADGGRLARHAIPITFGEPIHIGPGDHRLEVMERVRLHMEACGAETTQDPKLVARRRATAKKQAAA